MNDMFPASDDLSDIISAPVDADPARAAKAAAATEANVGYVEKCPKCRGRGQFVSYSGRVVGRCFHCKGKGSQTFKTSPEARAQNRATAAARRVRTAAENVEAFKAEFAAEYEWLVRAAGRGFEIATSILTDLPKYGTNIHEGRLNAVRRFMAQDIARAEARAERAASAPTVDAAGVDKLKAAFETAKAYSAAKGLRLSPRLTIGGITISPAKETGKNPGALYVKQGDTYLGKIADGRLFGTRDCTPEIAAQVQRFICEPAEAAKVYGQTTGTCCVCNATLRSEWKHRGIGPICAEKFGW